MKITRYSPGGYGAMVEDSSGEYVRLSEIEPLVQKAVDQARDSGIFAGSLIADENAEELAKLRDLLRWRKVGEEMPTEEDEYLVFQYGHPERMYWREDSDWRGITHWRPIGPMPAEEVKP